MAILKYGLLVVLVVIIGYILIQYFECRKRGKASRKSYRCEFCSDTPVPILPVDEYYDIGKDGECYHYIDYGDAMSMRKVGMDKCN